MMALSWKVLAPGDSSSSPLFLAQSGVQASTSQETRSQDGKQVGPGPKLDGSLSSRGQAADDCQLDLGPTEVFQQSSGTVLVPLSCLKPTAGVGGGGT